MRKKKQHLDIDSEWKRNLKILEGKDQNFKRSFNFFHVHSSFAFVHSYAATPINQIMPLFMTIKTYNRLSANWKIPVAGGIQVILRSQA